MLGSTSEKSFVRLKTNRTTQSIVDSTIHIDFDDVSRRRSSFLPENLAVDDLAVLGQEKRSFSRDVTYCGAAFVMSMERTDPKVIHRFLTGSKYLGTWNRLGIAGKGLYKYPHGAVYDGHFNRNGEFHGSGIVTYPNGQRLEGFWKNGKLSPGATFVTKDNTVYNEEYCIMPDRRYQIEIATDLKPADQENLTNSQPPITIPAGFYDAGDGFYDPILQVIKSYPKTEEVRTPLNAIETFGSEERKREYTLLLRQTPSETALVRPMLESRIETKNAIEAIPMAAREEWIQKNCRRAFDDSRHFMPELYETWTTGARKYIHRQSTAEPDYFVSSRRERSTIDSCHYGDSYLDFKIAFPSTESVHKRSSLHALSTMFLNPPGFTRTRIISFKQFTHKDRHSEHHRSIHKSPRISRNLHKYKPANFKYRSLGHRGAGPDKEDVQKL